MADRWLLEDSSGAWTLEDSSGYWLIDFRNALYSMADFAGPTVMESGISVTERILPWGAIK